jgi:hypothetical protein
MTKQLVGFAAAVMTTLLALAVLWQFQIVVVYLLISLALAAVLRPLVNRLAGRRFVTRLAWIVLYLAALASFGVLLALAVWVKPRLFKRSWDNPVLTVVLLLAMADAFGLVGIILAQALSVVCQILWSRLVSRRTASGATAQVSDLRERHARVWDTIRAMDGPPLALLTSSMERLDQLIAKAEPILQAGQPADDRMADLLQPVQPPRPIAAEGGPPVATTA